MLPIESRIDSASPAFASQRTGMQALIERLRALADLVVKRRN